MTLPASGQISISAINTEYGRTSTSDMDASLTTLSTEAEKTQPDSMSEFYNLTASAVEYGTETILHNESMLQDRYSPINRSYHTSPNTLDVTIQIYLYVSTAAVTTVYYRKNSGSWVSLATRNTAGTTNTSYTISSISYNDVIDVRTYIAVTSYNNYARATISGVSWYTGSGVLVLGDNLIQQCYI
jgi:hypothetical protein